MSSQEPQLHLTTNLSVGEQLEAQQEVMDLIAHPPTPVRPQTQWGSTDVNTDMQGLLYMAQQAVREAGLAADSTSDDPRSPWIIATSEAAVVLVACAPVDRYHSRALVFAASTDSPTAENVRNQVRSAIDRLGSESILIDKPEQGLEPGRRRRRPVTEYREVEMSERR
jgi:hypothetical protein